MKILGFDLLSLFKAPVVTEEPVIPEPQEPMPVEYNEVDTSSTVTVGNAPPTIPEIPDMHQKMYEISTSTPTTVGLDPMPDPWQGGSENFQGGSENLG